MSTNSVLRRLGQASLCILILAGLVNCGQPQQVPASTPTVMTTTGVPTVPATVSTPTHPPTVSTPTQPPTVSAPTGPTSITVVIPEDPPSFNAVISDTGYDALVMHMTLLGMTGVDPQGNIFPVLAAELPSVENGEVVVNEQAGTMVVSW